MKVIVNITQEDIERGERGHPLRCPNARALQRAFQDPLASSGTYTCGPSNGVSYRLPKKASIWIERFDRKKKCKPLRYQLTDRNRMGPA